MFAKGVVFLAAMQSLVGNTEPKLVGIYRLIVCARDSLLSQLLEYVHPTGTVHDFCRVTRNGFDGYSRQSNRIVLCTSEIQPHVHHLGGEVRSEILFDRLRGREVFNCWV